MDKFQEFFQSLTVSKVLSIAWKAFLLGAIVWIIFRIGSCALGV